MNQEPTKEHVKNILQKHFEVEILSVERMPEGYTHYMYDCECQHNDGRKQNFIVRISYNKKDTSDIAKELAVMEECQKKGVSLPEIYAFDIQKTIYPFDYMIMEKLGGVPLKKILEELSLDEKKDVARKVGELLSKLHSIKFDSFGDFTKNGVKVEEEFGFRKLETAPKINLWIRKMLKDAFSDLSGLVTLDMIHHKDCAKIIDYLQSNKELLLTAEPVLIHNDFHPDHILVEKIGDEWIINGIVDFEFASSFAREFDFIKLHRAGLIDDVIFRDGLMEGYGKDNLHPEFNLVLEYYRLIRDIGFAFHLAKAGNFELMKTILENVMKVVDS